MASAELDVGLVRLSLSLSLDATNCTQNGSVDDILEGIFALGDVCIITAHAFEWKSLFILCSPELLPALRFYINAAACGGNSSTEIQVLTQFARKSFIPSAVFIIHASNEQARSSRCECDFPMQIFYCAPIWCWDTHTDPITFYTQTNALLTTTRVCAHSPSTYLSAALCMCALALTHCYFAAFLFALSLTACECVKFELVAARYFQGNAKCLIGFCAHTDMLKELITNLTPRPLNLFAIEL